MPGAHQHQPCMVHLAWHGMAREMLPPTGNGIACRARWELRRQKRDGDALKAVQVGCNRSGYSAIALTHAWWSQAQEKNSSATTQQGATLNADTRYREARPQCEGNTHGHIEPSTHHTTAGQPGQLLDADAKFQQPGSAAWRPSISCQCRRHRNTQQCCSSRQKGAGQRKKSSSATHTPTQARCTADVH